MSKKIFSVGFEIPGKDIEYFSFRSDQSLFDADIILFKPSMAHEYSSFKRFEGKRLLSESDSFKVVEDATHWRSELQTAFDAGKTILIFLSKLEEVYIYTGGKEYSGTGRNRAQTNLVRLFNNYESIPVKFGRIIPKGGKEIRIAKDLKFLSTYWQEFSKYSVYEVYLEGDFKDVLFTTKTGNKIIGAIISGQKGTMMLLPPIRYEYDDFVEEDEEGKNYWNSQAIIFRGFNSEVQGLRS